MRLNLFKIFIVGILLCSCERAKKQKSIELVQEDSSQAYVLAPLPDSAFVVMNKYSDGFVFDMKYATEDNFLKKKVYACDHCLLRKEVADEIIRANLEFKKLGFRIKFFDCYRPVDVQKQMWEIFPHAGYVANPNTSGSIHNRGGAVDITLVDSLGQELDMGTPFDFFGKEAGHAYSLLPDTTLSNRKLLKSVMESYAFKSISSEWWHYNFKSAHQYKLSNFSTECD
ncbi:M15 family metallopeptidase [Reichenbachiella sp.]|uniref:M15 family metallopeptidase n=1 Tax=Reichenbachiella sp. TaxID=2184521 RepID=UPI00329A3F29